MAKDKKDIEIEEYDVDEDLDELTLADRLEAIEKKNNIALILMGITLTLCLFSVIFTINGSNSLSEDNTQQAGQGQAHVGYDTSEFKEIKASDIKSESKGKTIAIMVGRQGCGHCANYAPEILAAGKEVNAKIRYIDMDKMFEIKGQNAYLKDEQSYKALENLTGDGEWKTFVKENIGGTPLTIIVKNNRVVGGISGAVGRDTVAKAFRDAGLGK